MSSNKMENSFAFVVSSGPKLQADPAVRQLIRKQAMRDVGTARKRKGTYGKQNTGQHPRTDVPIRAVVDSTTSGSSRTDSPETASSDNSSSNPGTDDTELEELERQLVLATKETGHARPLYFARSMITPSSYETTRSRFNVDITDLSMLTNFNVSKSTTSMLFADPGRLVGLLQQRQWSYLQFVPSRYGQSPCLTAATDCVLAKVRTVLAPQSGGEEMALRLYAKALHSLQLAISDETSCMNSDVLCATQMLSLRELLDPARDSAWSHHINGSVRIVKHRSPRRFKTEFEKALFAAHVGPVVSEALLSNEDCYLAEPRWTALYLDMMEDSAFLTARSPLTLKIRLAMFKLPGLWRDVDVLVAGPQLFDDVAVLALELRCRALQYEILAWTEEYKAHCVRLSLASPSSNEIAMRRELFGTSLECLILVKRLLAAVCDEDRAKLEAETQALAHLILQLQKQPSPKHSWLFTGNETEVAYTTLATRPQWDDEVARVGIERKLATRNRYTTWSNTLRMSETA